jgi:HlyD family secretion protein
LKRSHKYALAAAGILAAGGAGLAFWPREKRETVRVAPVERVPELKAVVKGSGEIRTKYSVEIQAEIAGVIIDLPVREGDKVEKDQVLLKIDPYQTQTDEEAAKAQLLALEAEAAGQTFQIATSEANAARDEFLKKTAEVELRQAEANLARARETYGRDQKLLEAKLISPDQFLVSETQYKVDQAQIEAATARISQLEAQIVAAKAGIDHAKSLRDSVLQRVEAARSAWKRADDLLKKTTIRSPISGIIVKLNVEIGERAVPGILSNPQATLMVIGDFSLIEAELKVDETDIVNVKLEDPAKVVVDALPDEKLAGRVVEIGNSPITSSGGMGGGMGMSNSSQEGKDFKVVVRIETPPAALRPGMSCEADVTTAVKQDLIVIPVQALTLRDVKVDEAGRYIPSPPDEQPVAGTAAAAARREPRTELQGVFVAEGSRARFQPVKTGIVGEMDVEVLEGLEPGVEVVVGPLKALRGLKEEAAITIDRSQPFRRSSRARRGDEEDEAKERR